jgi:hypothetical protein
VVSEDPLPLALARPIELALARALSRSRAVRFPGLSDFVCALGVDGVAWTAVRPPGPARSQFSPPPRPGQERGPRRPTPLYVPVLLGALAASCALGIYYYLSTGGPQRGAERRSQPIAPPDLRAAAVPDLAPTPPLDGAVPPVDVGPPLPPLRLASEPAAPTAPPVVRTPPTPQAPPANVVRPQLVARPAQSPSNPTSAQTPPSLTPFSNDVDIQVTTDGPPLSDQHLDRVKYCIRLVRPHPPFSAILEPFRGTLFVSQRTPTPELRESSDFRNCLKNEVQGNIEAKDVYVKGILRGKTSP